RAHHGPVRARHCTGRSGPCKRGAGRIRIVQKTPTERCSKGLGQSLLSRNKNPRGGGTYPGRTNRQRFRSKRRTAQADACCGEGGEGTVLHGTTLLALRRQTFARRR